MHKTILNIPSHSVYYAVNCSTVSSVALVQESRPSLMPLSLTSLVQYIISIPDCIIKIHAESDSTASGIHYHLHWNKASKHRWFHSCQPHLSPCSKHSFSTLLSSFCRFHMNLPVDGVSSHLERIQSLPHGLPCPA